MRSPTFRSTRWRAGYGIDDVNELLADLPPRPTGPCDPGLAERIRDARFASVTFRPGDDLGEVDAYLDQLIAQASGGPAPWT